MAASTAVELQTFLGEWQDTMGHRVKVDWARPGSRGGQLHVELSRSRGGRDPIRLDVKAMGGGRFTCGHFDMDVTRSGADRIVWLDLRNQGKTSIWERVQGAAAEPLEGSGSAWPAWWAPQASVSPGAWVPPGQPGQPTVEVPRPKRRRSDPELADYDQSLLGGEAAPAATAAAAAASHAGVRLGEAFEESEEEPMPAPEPQEVPVAPALVPVPVEQIPLGAPLDPRRPREQGQDPRRRRQSPPAAAAPLVMQPVEAAPLLMMPVAEEPMPVPSIPLAAPVQPVSQPQAVLGYSRPVQPEVLPVQPLQPAPVQMPTEQMSAVQMSAVQPLQPAPVQQPSVQPSPVQLAQMQLAALEASAPAAPVMHFMQPPVEPPRQVADKAQEDRLSAYNMLLLGDRADEEEAPWKLRKRRRGTGAAEAGVLEA